MECQEPSVFCLVWFGFLATTLSAWTRDRIHVPCAGRKILIQSYHQGSPKNILLKLLISSVYFYLFFK